MNNTVDVDLKENLRDELTKMIEIKGILLDDDVIRLSQKLDKLIVQEYKVNIKN